MRCCRDLPRTRCRSYQGPAVAAVLLLADAVVRPRATAWLRFEPSQQSKLLTMFYTYVSFLFGLDMTAFVFTINRVKQLRPTLQHMFEAIGYIDATQGMAAWRKTLAHWWAPEFTVASKEIRVTALVHPLLKSAVANNVTITNRSALITGPNMSGQTTFIRALGVNAILAQSLGTVTTTRWRAPCCVS